MPFRLSWLLWLPALVLAQPPVRLEITLAPPAATRGLSTAQPLVLQVNDGARAELALDRQAGGRLLAGLWGVAWAPGPEPPRWRLWVRPQLKGNGVTLTLEARTPQRVLSTTVSGELGRWIPLTGSRSQPSRSLSTAGYAGLAIRVERANPQGKSEKAVPGFFRLGTRKHGFRVPPPNQ